MPAVPTRVPGASPEKRSEWARAQLPLSYMSPPSEWGADTLTPRRLRLRAPARAVHFLLPQSFCRAFTAVCSLAHVLPPSFLPLVDTVEGDTLVFYRMEEEGHVISALRSLQAHVLNEVEVVTTSTANRYSDLLWTLSARLPRRCASPTRRAA